jgi:serine/threonine protein kinase
VAIADGI